MTLVSQSGIGSLFQFRDPGSGQGNPHPTVQGTVTLGGGGTTSSTAGNGSPNPGGPGATSSSSSSIAGWKFLWLWNWKWKCIEVNKQFKQVSVYPITLGAYVLTAGLLLFLLFKKPGRKRSGSRRSRRLKTKRFFSRPKSFFNYRRK